jgi:hypothetical protein
MVIIVDDFGSIVIILLHTIRFINYTDKVIQAPFLGKVITTAIDVVILYRCESFIEALIRDEMAMILQRCVIVGKVVMTSSWVVTHEYLLVFTLREGL